jgi:IPT/TIG domain
VTAVSPNAGSKAGGAAVTITGTGFAVGTNTTAVSFATTPASEVKCASTTTCTLVTPAHATGKVDVKATVNGVASPKNTPADLYTYG